MIALISPGKRASDDPALLAGERILAGGGLR